jgi:hypothetical protein
MQYKSLLCKPVRQLIDIQIADRPRVIVDDGFLLSNLMITAGPDVGFLAFSCTSIAFPRHLLLSR